MERSILDAVLQAKQAKAAIVLATDLDSGAQRILDIAETGRTPDQPVQADQKRADQKRDDQKRDDQKRDGRAQDELRRAALAASIADRSQTVALEDGRRFFLNVFNPPLRMIVVGAVHITQALAPMARLAGYDVFVVDPRAAFASAERFPDVNLSHAWPDEAMADLLPDRRTAVITLTHDPKLDDPALQAALRSDCFYIGALGSKKTHAARLERLRRAGFDADAMGRIHGPIGLAIGARSPAEIAISVMAQVTETLRKMPEPQARAA